ncbi:MAG: hypothetical protein NTV11_08245 [Rhodocyclales bacterium]|nr:hypothetical protein [Rhodocyclales bacterium]
MTHTAEIPRSLSEGIRTPLVACLLVAFGAMLALPALADEPTPSLQSDDPLIAAALRYEHGAGVAGNAGRAAEMYCAAARQGNADAAYRLGWMYANGNGVERDDRHAAALFQRAASLGHGFAMRMPEVVQAGDARLPLCITLPPPPAVRVEADADREQPGQARQENSENASAEVALLVASVAPAPIPSPPVGDQILLAIARWVDAWALRQVDRYFAAYAPDFQPPAGESRQQWERQRRARITGKGWIDIRIGDLAIAVEGNQATVRFVQEYRSDKGRESVTKTLTLVKSERTWLIRQEQSEALQPSAVAR